MSMQCKKCKGKTVVIDSRNSGDNIRRRRKCIKCGYRFSTFEDLKETKKIPKEKPKVKKETEKKIIEEKLDDDETWDEDDEVY